MQEEAELREFLSLILCCPKETIEEIKARMKLMVSGTNQAQEEDVIQ